MGQPAARLTDMHTCPMVTGIVPHVGGPIIAPGCPTVLIGALPAARVSDECVCVGPTDVIVVGAFTTLIGGLPAARLGDATAHGGVIVVGDPTVLIGDGAGDDDDDDSDPDGDEADADADDGDEASEDALPDQSEDQAPTDTQATEAPDSAQPVEELHAQAELGDWNNPDYMASAPNVDAPAGADMGAASGLGDQTGLSAGEMGALPTNEAAPDGAFQLGATQNEDISSGAMDGSVAGGGQWSSGDVSGQVVGGGGADGGGLSTGEQAPAGAFQLNATQNTYNPSAGQSGSAPPPSGGPGPGVPSTGAPASPRSFQLNATQNTYNPAPTGSPSPPKTFKLGATQNVTVPPPRPPSPPAPPSPKTFKLGASQNVAVPPARPPPPAPPPARSGGFVPGGLSAHYESNGDPGRISTGKGDHGGVSFGAYQIIKGNLHGFVSNEGARWPELQGKTPGTPAFNNAWKAVAAKDRANFLEAQHAYINRTHYEPQIKFIRDNAQLDVGAHSHAFQDVAWSTAVQHGSQTSIFSDAVRNVKARGISETDPRFDRSVINAVYDERGRRRADGVLAHFHSSSAEEQRGVANRFYHERIDALKELALEHAAQNR